MRATSSPAGPEIEQRLLGQLALGDVVGDDAHGLPALVRDGAGADLNLDQGAVLAPVPPLADETVSFRQDALYVAVYALAVVGYDVVERQAMDLLWRVAQRCVEGRVGFKYALGFDINQEDVLGRLLHDGAVELLALAQGFLGPLAFGYVLHRAFVGDDLAPGVADGARAQGGPHDVPVLAVRLDLEPPNEAVPPHQPAKLSPALGFDVELLRDVRDVLEQLLGRVVAEHAGQGGVGRDEASLDRGLEDALHGVLEDGTVPLLRPPALPPTLRLA